MIRRALSLALLLAYAGPALAQDCMVGEVKLFAGNFAPRNYALANGQLLSISQNTALFSILGTTYGGDGQTTFALPDLRGRAPVAPGTGPGLPAVQLGQKIGASSVTLTEQQMPPHTHAASTQTTVNAASGSGNSPAPGGAVPAGAGSERIYSSNAPDAAMAAGMASSTTTVQSAGAGAAVSIQSPALGVNYIVCLFGIYPSRN